MKNQEVQPMIAKSTKLRSKHISAFRRGEWGMIVGVVMVTPDGREPRLCYAVRYDDGFTDYKTISDGNDNYEIEAI